MKILFPICLLASLFWGACTRKEAIKTSLVIDLKHFFGSQDLTIGNKYTNASGEELTITKFNYFISNIKLKKADGSEYAIPQDKSYFLIKLSDKTSQQFSLTDIPLGEYTGISFTLGVDSLRNTLEPSKRTGALDVGGAAEDMYWTWNQGYIFLKLEGTSPAITTTPNNQFFYHIGGYGGYNTPTINNLRNVNILFGFPSLKALEGRSSLVHLKVDLAELFKNPVNISAAQEPSVMLAPFSATVADNYVDMFSLDFVHN